MVALRWTAAACVVAFLAWGCGSDGTTLAPQCDASYPQGDHAFANGSVLPDVQLDSVDASGARATIALHDYYEPCAAEARLLVVRVSAAWCGPCRWHAAHTGEIAQLDVGARIEIFDVLVADDDNAPADLSDLDAWRARIDAPRAIAIDPAFQLGAVHGGARAALPLFVAVDRRTMSVVRVLDDPSPDALAYELRAAIADLDGAARPATTPPTMQDDRFTRDQWDLIRAMTLPDAPPPDPSNAHADDPAAAALGKKLFSDAALSPSGKSCASCHDPAKQLADGVPTSTGGVSHVDRNAPSIALAAHARWEFWDGRADSLWMQALGPPEAAAEIGSTRLFIAHVVWDKYKTDYEAVWGALPDLSDAARFPANGKPGSPEWATMAPNDQTAATRVYVDVGKSIAAFERTFRVQPNALDGYVAGNRAALTPDEKDGLAAFLRAGCAQCHYGPRFTDDAFHVLGLPTGRVDRMPDRGRIDGIAALLGAEFGASTTWSDAPRSGPPLVAAGSTLGAFKTPTLRGAPTTAPYGHGGTSPTLDDVIAMHGFVEAQSPLVVGAVEPWLPPVDDATRAAIVTFLRALTAEPIVP
jgi:cytochrome c peroxidase